MRYAEVLLLAAEAHMYRAATRPKALSYINRIRSRAKLPDLTTVTLDDVKKEKRLSSAWNVYVSRTSPVGTMLKQLWVSKGRNSGLLK